MTNINIKLRPEYVSKIKISMQYIAMESSDIAYFYIISFHRHCFQCTECVKWHCPSTYNYRPSYVL